MIIKVKYADDGNLDTACRNALKQIDEKHYADGLDREEYNRVLKYGIAFHLKKSRVLLETDRR